ncbi:hypothetical protein [Kitasatospora griseola]|uniref:hypothetical protein n=1 Tax=Kitasatospora griseola TaxID=2064 RepID=UPI00167179CC|nr:hypothetical protein [Kitasatospora griseola]GGR04999.1 hypothetical protein GCM10010195_70470 [Kitasatospora griseola]
MQAQLLVLEHEPRLRHASAVGMFLLVAGLPTLLVAGLPGVPTTARVVVGLCCTAIGAFLGVRAERAVVVCESDGILIRGFVRSRRIPVRAVVGLRGIHLYWCSPRGLDLSELTVWDELVTSAAVETKRRALPR